MDEGYPTQRRPSLYTAIRLARLVQHFRERLKARVKSRAQRNALAIANGNDLASFKSEADTQTQPKWTPPPKESESYCSPLDGLAKDYQLSSVLSALDRRLDASGHLVDRAAKNDKKLLAFDAQRLLNSRRIEQASNVLDNSTLLLELLHDLHSDPIRRQQAAARHGFPDLVDFEKYLANLDHLLRCLQQAAFQALVQHSLETLESDCRHWDKYLEKLRRSFDDWFSEWVGGRPPLSSTMPWNIKPSLVVLWGVCWMFYMTNAPSSTPGQSREDAWMTAQAWAQQANVQNIGRQPEAFTPSAQIMAEQNRLIARQGYSNTSLVPHQHTQILSHTAAAGRSPPNRLGNTIGPGTSQVEMIGSLGTSPFSQREGMTHSSPVPGHMTPRSTGFGAQVTQQAIYSGQQQPPRQDAAFLQKLVSSSAGLRTPVTASVATSLSDAGGAPFATPTSNLWSPVPTQDQQFSHNGIWQQPSLASEDISSRSLYPSVNPYAEQQQHQQQRQQHLDSSSLSTTTATSSPSFYPVPEYGLPQGHQYGTQGLVALPVPMHSTQNYPISPYSEASERASSVGLPNMPDQISPHDAQTSPSLDHSNSSRRGSIGQHEEPPRNHLGQIYCADPTCAPNPPIFSRKCEWTKHRDKHIRPYVCREPGCEKIRGFTYSGGLLRHEREVHRQHGGPKAPRFCPHKDCKRSTGQGFSRKENLNEHLRRVHRGVGIEDSSTTKEEQMSPQLPLNILPSQRIVGEVPAGKKRRREEVDDDGSGASAGMSVVAELRTEVKRLREELAMKDETIRHMREILQVGAVGLVPGR